MSSPSEGIRDLLVAAGLGTFAATTGWSVNIYKQPDAPDTSITIYPSGGKASSPKWLLDFPAIQVRVRGTPNGAVDAEAKCKAVENALLGLPSQDLNGDRWVMITQISPTTFVGFDDSNRPQFTANFQLTIEPASGTYRESL